MRLDPRTSSEVDTENTMSGQKERALKSGELARAAGISADTLCHYEKLGLLPLPARSESGYRLYPPETLAQVQMIRSAVRVGFTLTELADVLKQRRAGRTPCRQVAELATQHLDDLNQRIVELTQLRDWLAGTLEAWQVRLQSLKAGERAAFLESLPQPKELNSQITKGTHHEASSIDMSRTRHRDNLRSRTHETANTRKRR
jgi:DNA-binding transcriptional MerR regulator